MEGYNHFEEIKTFMAEDLDNYPKNTYIRRARKSIVEGN